MIPLLAPSRKVLQSPTTCKRIIKNGIILTFGEKLFYNVE